jgi:hypothetical protein
MAAQVVRSGHHGGRGKCAACLLPTDQQEQLNEDLVRGVPLHRLSKRWHINRESLRSHKTNHISPALKVLRTERIANGVRKVSDRVEDLIADTAAILGSARRSRNAFQGLKAIREQRANYELLARITGELDERPQVTINLQQTAQWIDVRTIVFEELRSHPEIARKIAGKLRLLDGGKH